MTRKARRKMATGICVGVAAGVVVGIISAYFLGFLVPREVTIGPLYPRISENRERENIAPYENQILGLAENLKRGVVSLVAPPPGGAGGTGFIVHGGGYILTNRHVVENQLKFEVSTTTGGKYTASVLAKTSPENEVDVAVLKVDVQISDVAVLKFGDSKTLKDKDIVFGLGHPMVFGSWVITAGEYVAVEYGGLHTMYIDKPGGSGESGSPLFSMEGKVVGIIFGGTALAGRPLITSEDNVVVWWGNAEKYRNEAALANTTDSIYEFLVQSLGKELADQIFAQ